MLTHMPSQVCHDRDPGPQCATEAEKEAEKNRKQEEEEQVELMAWWAVVVR